MRKAPYSMGRKRVSKQAGVAHKEAFQRMNYLYQAALASLSATPSQPQLSRFYIHTMRTISKRLVLRIDPSIKRTMCKSCDSLLIPGLTCSHRIRAHRERHVVVRCLTCGTIKRYLARKDYLPWAEREENIADAQTQPKSQDGKKQAEQ